MTVRAKFFVSEIKHLHNGAKGADQAAVVKLSPVYGDENKPWSKFTPQGSIELMITNPSAIEAFSPGEAYFVDFTPAE